MSRRDDELLIQGVFDHDVTETDFEQLEARLRDEPELRELYHEYARLNHALCEEFEGRAHLEERLRSLRDAPPERETWVRSVLSAAAILMLLAVAAYFIGVRPYHGMATVSYGPETVATIAHANGTTHEGRLRKGSRLVLKHGTAQLELPSGVRAVVEGPATVEGAGRNALKLESGRAWFRVPSGAEGFTCSTPALAIKDLGTEFGVIAAPGGQEEVQVLEGRVRVHPHHRPGEIRELEAGQGLAWSGGQFALPRAASRFVTSLPKKRIIMSDDFSEPNDTALHGKRPDAGAGPWIVTAGTPLILDESVDSAGTPSTAFVAIDTTLLDEVNHILLVTIDTGEPDSRVFHSGGWAGVSLFAESKEHLFVGDPYGPETRWSLHPFHGEVAPSDPPLHGKQVVTLRYDFRTGLAEMFHGHKSRGPVLARATIAPGVHFDQLRIGNGEGGDLAVRLLRASVLVSDATRAEGP
ncbi:MAG: FecR domain-containing protein [Akkermansiaceae bacterium]|nr:FecR domain-containing protein [Akkermansiaceae bacterium]NNM29602.1 FecR domain-containing protein [Akkermansiaceae bacterium]